MPSIVAIAIICIVIITMSDKETTNEALKEVEPFNFVEYIEQRVNTEITNGDINNFEALYKVIDIEEHLINTENNKNVLSQSEAKECYEYLFDRYFNEFKKKADVCFSSSNWSNCNIIKNEANRLLKRNGSNKSQKQTLASYVEYVNNFNSICTHIRNCRSKENYTNIKSSSYLSKVPYSNNRKMQSALTDAKSNWENYLIKEYSNFKDYSSSWSCSTFIYNKEDLQGKIQDFGLQFSPNNDFRQGLTTTLSDVYNELTNTNCKSSSNTYYHY